MAVNGGMWRDLTSHRPVAAIIDVDHTEPWCIEPWLPDVCDALRRVLVQVVLVSEARRSTIDAVRGLAPGAWWYVEHGAWRYATNTWVGQRTRRELDELASELVSVLTPDVQLQRTAVSLVMLWGPHVAGALAATAGDLFARWAVKNPAYQLTVGPTRVEVRLRSATKKAAVTWVRQRLPEVRCVLVGIDEAASTPLDIAVPSTHAHASLSLLAEIRAVAYPAEARQLVR